jgi:hypothetical protein
VISVLILSLYFVFHFLHELRYLLTLFEHGLGRSSYLARELKAEYLVDVSLYIYPLAIYSGFGKEFFGIYSSSMDNEHLYILLVWGVLFYVLFILIVFYALFLYFKRVHYYFLLFAFPMLIGVPLAWASSFYLAPKISMLLIIAFSISFKKFKNTNENLITCRC